MGISYDEMQRMKTNQLKYIENQYPLVEKAIRRRHCLTWLKDRELSTPPDQLVLFCPYHTNEVEECEKKNERMG